MSLDPLHSIKNPVASRTRFAETMALHTGPTRSRALSHELAIRLLARLGTQLSPVQRIEAGRWLRGPGQWLDALPYVESGRIDAILHTRDAGSQVIPVSFGPGELALLSALFSQEPVQSTIVAAEPLRVRWLPVPMIEQALTQEPELMLILVRFLGRRLREVQDRERGWLERGVHGRVGSVLARLAMETPPAAGEPWLIRMTHEYLAQRCGVSRPKLSGELKELERAGVVRIRRGAIELVDYRALAAPPM
jgi:CRP-like cAMP-binding protein